MRWSKIISGEGAGEVAGEVAGEAAGVGARENQEKV